MLRSKLFLAGAVLLAGCARPAERAAVEDTSATGPGPRSPTGAGTSAAPVVTAPVVTAPVVTARGVGALRAGTSVAEASAALGGALVVPAGADTAGCRYVEWRGGPRGVRVMVEGGRIARIDVDSADTAGVATAAGVRVGDSEARVQSLYGGRVAVSPHKYEEGHYLTVADPADTNFALVFETARGRVTRYRAGRRPQVEYVEGCG